MHASSRVARWDDLEMGAWLPHYQNGNHHDLGSIPQIARAALVGSAAYDTHLTLIGKCIIASHRLDWRFVTRQLLSTKIQIPPIPPRLVKRGALLNILDHSLQPNIRLTLLSAPAGYGKTTLLCAWLQSRSIPAAWLSISEGDNDPARFLRYLIAAAEGATDSISVAAGKVEQESENGQQQMLVGLINEVSQLTQQMVLVLDDYHLIESQAVHDLIVFLLEYLPVQAHLIIATRADPPLPLARLRGRGQINELRMQDLRFNLHEAGTLLKLASGQEIDSQDIEILYRRTEGWASGLQMAAASLRGNTDVKEFVSAFSGSQRYIMEYLLDEVLHRQPEERQTFLLQTSILDRLCGPLCDAVCETDAASSKNKRMLEALEMDNLFIVPMDERREWYRYHRLFSDLLQARLHRERLEEVPALHRRASKWFEDHGYIDEAIHHALLSGDDTNAISLVEQYAQEILLKGETTTFLRWLSRLPEEQIKIRPRLCIYRAWSLLLQGAPLHVIEAHIDKSRAISGPPGSAQTLEAFILLSQGRIRKGLQLAEQALASLPAEEVYLRNFAAICIASSRISIGDVEGGMQVAHQAAQTSKGGGYQTATAMMLC